MPTYFQHKFPRGIYKGERGLAHQWTDLSHIPSVTRSLPQKLIMLSTNELIPCLLLCFSVSTPSLLLITNANSRHIKRGLDLVNAQDLNFILPSDNDEQLWTSHLILCLIPLYTSYQNPGSAFLTTHPFMTYIDVRLSRFLPNIFMNKARMKGPRWVREGSL